MEEQVRYYRTTTETWFGRFLLPFAFATLLIITAVNAAGLHPALGGIALLVLAVMAVFEYLLPMLRTWVRLDARIFEGYLSGQSVHVYWSEVIAAWTLDQGQRRFLCLGTRQGTNVLPLRFLPADKIWAEIRQRVPAAALEPDAMQRLPDYQEWMNARDTLIHQNFAPRQVVDHWVLQLAGWMGVAFWASLGIEAWAQNNWVLLLCLTIPGILALSLVMHWGITEIDPQGIRRRTMLGVWEIRWEDLRWLEMDLTGTTLVLGGENCQMVISGPVLWAGPDRLDMLAMIQAQAEYRRLPMRRSLWAMFRVSFGTRVKKK